MNKSEEYGVKIFNINYIIIASMISLLNSLYYANFPVMCLLAAVQIIVLVRYLIKGQDIKYLCLYIIFLSTSMESALFVGVDKFYGFKEFKIASINLGVIFILLPFLKFIINGSIQNPFKAKGYVGIFVKGVYILTPLAFFMGLFGLLLNDNNILSKITSFSMFIDASYIFILVAVETIVIYTIVKRNLKDINEIKQCLLAIIISLAVTLVSSLLFENYGNRGGLPSLQVSNIIMLLVCAVLLPFYKDYNKKVKAILLLITGTILILGLIYNTNGKMILTAMLVPIATLIIQLRRKLYRATFLTLIIGFFMIYLSLKFIVPSLSSTSFLFSTKLEQASSMLLFGSGWLENMPSSPKMRITQILNITSEYFEKPWFIFTGKGYLGTIKDNLSFFTGADEFAYSSWQLNNGLYYMMHETLNTLYLTNGIIGLVFFGWMFKIIISKFHKSPWMMVGGFWFLLFYSYSVTISIFGVTALIIGLLDLDQERISYKKKHR
ncbi:hypothetical protein [Bacillus dicomae]|uniref:Uncharacterized protein n=1 Tax=Bacillus dicomae TaxID=3088378 RepID=A0AC61T2F2_9BACI|nr:hypothetical protein [Bacillus dicomae]TPV41407.1 hypothetical protein FJ659_20715 [Bacillus dicomae]